MEPAAHKRTFHTLDALRGIAALVVVVRHAPGLFASCRAPGAGLAVDLFFVISGIVLARAYDGRLARGMGTLAFMRLRVIRLYPLYAVGLSLGAFNAVASLTGHDAMGWSPASLGLAVALGLAMLPGPSPATDGRLFALNIPTWSLFFELAANFLYARFHPWITARRLGALCLACVPLLALTAWRKGDLDQGVMASEAGIGLLRTLFSFSVGLLLARTMPTHVYRRSLVAFLALVAGVAAMLLAPVAPVLRGGFDLACILVVIPGLAILAIRVEPPVWLVPACATAGLTSYAVYVIHAPLVALLGSLAGHFGWTALPGDAPWSGLVFLAGVSAAGWLLDRVYDAPLRRVLLDRLKAKHSRAVEPVAGQPQAVV